VPRPLPTPPLPCACISIASLYCPHKKLYTANENKAVAKSKKVKQGKGMRKIYITYIQVGRLGPALIKLALIIILNYFI